MRKTIIRSFEMSGVGLHSGDMIWMRLSPATSGISFTTPKGTVEASWRNVSQTSSALCTMLVSPLDDDVRVSTVEHLMAAFAIFGITDVSVELSGEEVPVMDGSALAFVAELRKAGSRLIFAKRKRIVVRRPIIHREGDAWAAIYPASDFSASYYANFSDPAIGEQRHEVRSMSQALAEISSARTFCFQKDVEEMRRAGKALGGNLSNAVVFENGRVLTPGGLRYQNEPARHKLLDAIGDLWMSNADIVGRFEGHKSGHRMTNALLRDLFEDVSVREPDFLSAPFARRRPEMAAIAAH